MSISNNPLKATTPMPLASPSPSPVVHSPSPLSSETPKPTTAPSPRPEAFGRVVPKPAESALPSSEQIQHAEAHLDQVAPEQLQARAEQIPQPLGLKIIAAKANKPVVAEVTTKAFTREQFGKQLIGPNFASNAKELLNTWFFKGAVLERATAKAERIASDLPRDSDLMHTLVGLPEKDLREMVAHGIAQTRPDKYNDQTTYAQLSTNKQKLVDAIVKGLRQGLPTDLEGLRGQTANTGADMQQVARKGGLMQELQQTQLRAPSQETLDKLDKMASRGIDHAKAKIKTDHEALRTQLSYQNLPVPDPAEVSLGVLGDDKIRALGPVDGGLHLRAENLIKDYTGADKDKLLWTLAMRPFGQTVGSVAARLYPGVNPLNESQKEASAAVAQALLQASLKQLGSASGNNLVKADSHGNPETIQINGKEFTQVRKLGEGGFGRAFLFRSAEGEEVVVKKFMRKGMDEENWFANMQDETRAHRYAMGPDGKGHENVLGLKGVVVRPPGQGEQFGEFFTVTEAAKGGELRDLMGNLHQQLQDKRISKQVYDLLNRQLFAQVVEGMSYVQQNRQMLHLDLKPENVFMTSDGRAKVADFGLANIGMTQRGAGGTSTYMAPEVAEGHVDDRSQRKHNDIDYHADTWTLGVIGRELFKGEVGAPSQEKNMYFDGERMRSNPLADAVDFASDKSNKVYKSAPDSDLRSLGGFHQLINSMMDPDPSKRPTLEAVKSHEFVSDPILHAPQMQTLLSKLMISTDGMSKTEKAAHREEIARLNTEIESLARH